ncbi:LysR family transcriptional regulator [Thermomonas fusca]|uniref:LysR family transcriptional regulator n=1 Tax=Thermomonas fusca TaxID=215690 RepID=A0A5R9PIB6_9GAMM|nr:LysR family transcriptional regulator [Thermomonas fusca]TLX22797.1 LysR family transcriptional regulator [Thermomonas fusca]
MRRQSDVFVLGAIELFCIAAEAGSFTAAAKHAGVTPAAVSRAMAKLEQRLGVRLFARTTRKVRLTDAGQVYFAKCKPALAQLTEAEREVSGQQLLPAGTVRISVPTPIGHHLLLPLLTRFRVQYPQVRMDVHLSNRNVDFSSEEFDLAIRGRDQPDSGLVVRKLLDAPLCVVAAPDYLARHGTPRKLDDLAAHDCIQFLLPRTGLPVPWRFRTDDGEVELATEGGLHCAEDLLGTATLARAGGGLLQTYRFIVDADLRQGVLEEVLPQHAGCTRPFSLVYPGARHMPLRVRLLIDFLVAAVDRPATRFGIGNP